MRASLFLKRIFSAQHIPQDIKDKTIVLTKIFEALPFIRKLKVVIIV